MFNELEKAFELDNVNVAEYSPLTLAYMGDCVYEFIIWYLHILKEHKETK